MGLIGKTSGSGSEYQIENPKAFVLVTFDSLVVAEYGDSVGESVVVNVNETGTKEGDCGFDGIGGDCDVNGQSGCDAVGDCGEQGELHGGDDR